MRTRSSEWERERESERVWTLGSNKSQKYTECVCVCVSYVCVCGNCKWKFMWGEDGFRQRPLFLFLCPSVRWLVDQRWQFAASFCPFSVIWCTHMFVFIRRCAFSVVLFLTETSQPYANKHIFPHWNYATIYTFTQHTCTICTRLWMVWKYVVVGWLLVSSFLFLFFCFLTFVLSMLHCCFGTSARFFGSISSNIFRKSKAKWSEVRWGEVMKTFFAHR